MAVTGQGVAVDDTDTSMLDTGTSPSGASITNIVRGYSIDQGGYYADLNAKSTLVGGLTPFV